MEATTYNDKSSEDEYVYDKLLLATGGSPIRLPFGGEEIIYYRTLQDYQRLQALAEQGRRFLVIGAGFIGSEIAASLSTFGKQVTIIFREDSIDEPAFREGLPLRRADQKTYLQWAIECFGLASSGVRDETQIHTHMCYAEFNNIIEAIGRMDADVISVDASRSKMELLDTFKQYQYPGDIGPGIYDIHSTIVKALIGRDRPPHTKIYPYHYTLSTQEVSVKIKSTNK